MISPIEPNYSSSHSGQPRQAASALPSASVSPQRHFLVQARHYAYAGDAIVWNSSRDDRVRASDLAAAIKASVKSKETRENRMAIDAMTVIALVLMGIGVVISLTVGVSAYGIVFPVGAILLFIAFHLDRLSKLRSRTHA